MAVLGDGAKTAIQLLSGERCEWLSASIRSGGAIYTLGAQGNLPFEMPTKYRNTSTILPPSMQQGNYIHDAGSQATAVLDHDGIGAGSHSPGGLYSDEGTTNMNIVSADTFSILACFFPF